MMFGKKNCWQIYKNIVSVEILAFYLKMNSKVTNFLFGQNDYFENHISNKKWLKWKVFAVRANSGSKISHSTAIEKFNDLKIVLHAL